MIAAIIALFFPGTDQLYAQNIPNPVLPRIADAGVIKYNGKYYIGGVFTNGGFYVSNDLIHWEGPTHVFSMNNNWTEGLSAGDNQIHANDIIYLNGKFQMYWSVNYWGSDKHVVHIGHAVSDNILGPYHEPMKETWIDNRIDPKVFRDDDGKLYMYMVRFTDGNTIWARPMKDAYSFAGHPVYQFASLPGTWETMDNRVAEGPWVMKYRNRYYMMYNANHTGTEWGNYQLGVAEADSPATFNHGTKYSYPVLLSNQTKLEEQYVDLLRYEETYNPMFAYTFDVVDKDWNKLSYDDSTWKKGKAGFASENIKGATVRKYGTEWITQKLYLRKVFSIHKSESGNLALRITHDGDSKVYLNGSLIYDKQGADYCIVNLDKKVTSLLKEGKNILAVESQKGHKNYLNISLFNMKTDLADDILFSPGQPNILRGPNGFEWWLVYMANKNMEHRGQYINRVHFFDKTMYADGITSTKTKGYFPEPTKPTYGEIFDDKYQWRNAWNISDTTWTVNNGEFTYPGNYSSYAILKGQFQATAYYFETGVNTNANAGVIAWWKDDNNWIKVGLNAALNNWYFQECLKGKINEQSYPLPADFKFGVNHTITIERNIETLSIRIDNIPAPGQSVFYTSISEKGLPGIFTDKCSASFDGVVYTMGWDEYDEKIASWGNSSSGDPALGNYHVSSKGMQVTSTDKFQAFKGDLISQYEYSLQINNLTDTGNAGIYPVYVDKDNYIKTGFNYATQKLEVLVMQHGKVIIRNDYSLENLCPHYADIKYTDFIEKGYTFASPTWINTIWLNRIASHDNNLFIDNMFDKVSVEYMSDGKWFPFSHPIASIAKHPGYSQFFFDPVKADALRFINKEANDLNPYIYKIQVNELFKQSYNLRTVKKKNMIFIFVDGKEICHLDTAFPAAQVGIYSSGCIPSFNGILRYHIP